MGACNFNAILEQFLKDFTCFLLIDRFDDLIVRGIWLKSLLSLSSSMEDNFVGTVWARENTGVMIHLFSLEKKDDLQIHYFWIELDLHGILNKRYLFDLLDMKVDCEIQILE